MTTVFPYQLTLEAATVVTAHPSVGNLIEGLDYVPGGALLGALAARVGPSHPHFGAVFLSETVRFLDAHPTRGGTRALPAPFSLFQEKGRRGPARYGDVAASCGRVVDLVRDELAGFDNPTSVSGWLVPHSGNWRSCDVQRRSDMHNRVHDERQRPEDDGLYTLNGLAAERRSFAGFLVCEDDTLAGWLRDTFSDVPLRLGRARRSGYGSARFQLGPAASDGWSEAAAGAPASDGRLVVTCLSDVIPSADPLAPEATLDPEALADALASDSGRPTLTLVEQFVRLRRADGWSGVQGLPRSSVVALRRGSVLVFSVAGDVGDDALTRAELRGLGARRNEGYGRVAFDWALHAYDWPIERTPPARPLAKPTASSERRRFPDLPDEGPEEARDALRTLRRRAWTRVIREQVEGTRLAFFEKNGERNGVPERLSASQLQRMLRKVLAATGPIPRSELDRLLKRGGREKPIEQRPDHPAWARTWLTWPQPAGGWKRQKAIDIVQRLVSGSDGPGEARHPIWATLGLEPPPRYAGDPEFAWLAVQELLTAIFKGTIRQRQTAA